MQTIKNVAILGAGAMGAYFTGKFFDTSGFSTVLIATGQRKDRL
jgi:2-dehydropantoate 2-reductase